MLGKITSLFVVVGALVVSRAANAQDYTYGGEEPNDFSYAWSEPRMPTGIGVGVILGGGIMGFTDQTMRNLMSNNVGGLWDARVSIGTHIPIGVDVSYVGTASSLNTGYGANNTTLIGTALEAALRWNILPHYPVDPYVFAGAGWQNYQVSGMTFSSFNGIRGSSNSPDFPMGVGVAFRDPSGWLVDVRGTFRAQPDSNLVFQPTENAFASTHQWEASAALGYEF